MKYTEYRVEVFKHGIWQPIGYDDIFDSYEIALDDLNYRVRNDKNHNKYRIAARNASEWKEWSMSE